MMSFFFGNRRRVYSMKQILLVGLGGAIGSVARYLMGVVVIRMTGIALPFNTLFVNVVGSFVMGLVIAMLVKLDPLLSNNSIEDGDRLLAWVQCRHYCRFCS